MAQSNLPYTRVNTAIVPGIGTLTYLGEQPYEDGNQYSQWRCSVSMLLQFGQLCNKREMHIALESVLFPWSWKHHIETEVGYVLSFRYEYAMRSPANFMRYWAARISEAYLTYRKRRESWPTGVKIDEGTFACRTGNNSQAMVYVWAHIQMYDVYGANFLTQMMPAHQVVSSGYLSEEALKGLPVVWLPCGFFED